MFRGYIRWTTISLCIIAVLAIAPNVYWLRGSSVIVYNLAAAPLPVRLALADNPDQLVELGEVGPGRGRFRWIHPVGEATLEVDVHDGTVWRRHCSEYVEQTGYRVEIVIRSPREVTCQTDLPLLRHVLLLDVLA